MDLSDLDDRPPRPADADLQRLVAVGERAAATACYSAADIARFADMSGDVNPVHRDREAARRAGLPDVIATGQHTSALMSGLAASYFSRGDDGVARDMLCLHFNFAYKAPVFPDQPLALEWLVAETEWNATLGGVVAQLDGRASVDGVDAVVARGTVLVRAAAA